jgi:subtilase family serine protease
VAVVAGFAGFAPVAGATTWSATSTKAMKLVRATKLGALPPKTKLELAIGLKMRNTRGLTTFIKAVDTPGNPKFGHFLSPKQFAARYAPTAAEVKAVTKYLRSHGFTHIRVSSNRLYITAQGTARDAELAFHTSIARYLQFRRHVYANTSAAKVPARLSGVVLSVLGLSDVSSYRLPVGASSSCGLLNGLSVGLCPIKAKTLPSATTGTNCTLNPTSGSPYGLCYYTPQGFRTAYDAGSLTGSSTTIAIMAEGDLSGVVKDLRTAEAAFGEPQVPYTIEQVGAASSDTSGADEWDLDTQYSTGMASTVQELYIYDATSLTDEDVALEFNTWVTQDLAKAGSASFGECEATPYADGMMVSNDEAMSEAAAQGQTMHASSGDTGGQSCAVAPTNGVPESGLPEVNYPCSSPYIVCVGGTSLFTNADGSYDNEISWVAGGGGVSDFEYSPYWQQCVVPSNAGMNEVRGVPDLAMDADENTGAEVYVNGSPETVGGTSLSSPLALGSWAMMETSAGNALGFASPLIYSLYPTTGCQSGVPVPQTSPLGTATNDPGYPFHDVYLGSNGTYPATPGWDYDTGLGTYDVQKVAAALDGLS